MSLTLSTPERLVIVAAILFGLFALFMGLLYALDRQFPEGPTIEAGDYVVGETVEPGIYWTRGLAGPRPCFYTLGSRVDESPRGPALVTIYPQDAGQPFHTRGCQPWVFITAP